ncbi:hypothetical protein [Cryptosporangium sp. NPDC051539]|uniref:hypothetical protein n=1 Tax=Cryptosporangium sp. NPDC051539 TaxID=3363962 RepID=UPI0037A79251
MVDDATDTAKTAAFREFEENLAYAREIVQGGQWLEKGKVGGFEVTALYRAAWMQAMTAVDRWVHRELYERAVAIAVAPQAQRPKAFLKLQIPMDLFEDVLHNGAYLSDRFTDFLLGKFGYQSFQNYRKIEEALAHVGPTKIWGPVAERLGMATQDLQGRLGSIVDRRNHIAHEADRDPDNHGQRLPMSADQVTDVIDFLLRVVTSLEDVLGPAPEAPAIRRPGVNLTREPGKRVWTRHDVDSAVAELATRDAATAEALRRLLQHADAHGASFKGGTGPDPSAGLHYPNISKERRSLWSLYLTPAKPSITLSIGSLLWVDEKVARQFLTTARHTPELDAVLIEPDEALLRRYPTVALRPLATRVAAIDGLLAAFDAVLYPDGQISGRGA